MKYIHPLSLEISVVRNVRKDLGLAWPSAGKRRSSAPRAMLTKATKNLLRRSPTSRASKYIKFVKIISSLHSKKSVDLPHPLHPPGKKYEKETCEVHSVWIWSGLTGVQPSSDQRKKKHRKLCHAMSKCLLKMCSNAIHCCTCKVTNPASGQFMWHNSEAKFHTDASCHFAFIESRQSLHCEEISKRGQLSQDR